MRSNAASAPERGPRGMRHRSAYWLRLAIAVALGGAFALVVVRMSATRRVNTEDGERAIMVARTVAAGRARWGVTDYTHHPLGPA